jgi:putative FmdB family regulatory protein
MPLVDYRCPQCGKDVVDVFVKTTAEACACPSCGAEMAKLPPNSNWQFSRKDRRWDA